MAVKILGKQKLQQQLRSLSPAVNAALVKSMGATLVQMESDVKSGIQRGGRSGKIYKRGGVSHQASAPGELPKTDRGGLVGGFLFNVKRTATKIVGALENVSKYAAFLEFKPASDGGRPFMAPLYKKWKPIAINRFKAIINKELKQSGK